MSGGIAKIIERYLSSRHHFYVNALRNTSTYGWFQLDLPGSGVGQSWHSSNDGETALADATDPRGGHSYVRFLEQSLQDLEHVCLTTRLGAIDQIKEVWAIIEARWKDLKFLSLLIMNLISGIELFNEIGYYI